MILIESKRKKYEKHISHIYIIYTEYILNVAFE